MPTKIETLTHIKHQLGILQIDVAKLELGTWNKQLQFDFISLIGRFDYLIGLADLEENSGDEPSSISSFKHNKCN